MITAPIKARPAASAEARQQIRHRRRQYDAEQYAEAVGAERARHFEIFARHRAGAVGDVHDDGEHRGRR